MKGLYTLQDRKNVENKDAEELQNQQKILSPSVVFIESPYYSFNLAYCFSNQVNFLYFLKNLGEAMFMNLLCEN